MRTLTDDPNNNLSVIWHSFLFVRRVHFFSGRCQNQKLAGYEDCADLHPNLFGRLAGRELMSLTSFKLLVLLSIAANLAGITRGLARSTEITAAARDEQEGPKHPRELARPSDEVMTDSLNLIDPSPKQKRRLQTSTHSHPELVATSQARREAFSSDAWRPRLGTGHPFRKGFTIVKLHRCEECGQIRQQVPSTPQPIRMRAIRMSSKP
uniref:Uncharacterized protein n=1 Tax=Branchiostoma floridae TaxID=7739 RepID=C3ZI81_BRAFL|eukprot:XP_002591812.1 hypothetical protein BRAFLDRAFT_83607 [Branchiostoma floridae]